MEVYKLRMIIEYQELKDLGLWENVLIDTDEVKND